MVLVVCDLAVVPVEDCPGDPRKRVPDRVGAPALMCGALDQVGSGGCRPARIRAETRACRCPTALQRRCPQGGLSGGSSLLLLFVEDRRFPTGADSPAAAKTITRWMVWSVLPAAMDGWSKNGALGRPFPAAAGRLRKDSGSGSRPSSSKKRPATSSSGHHRGKTLKVSETPSQHLRSVRRHGTNPAQDRSRGCGTHIIRSGSLRYWL